MIIQLCIFTPFFFLRGKVLHLDIFDYILFFFLTFGNIFSKPSTFFNNSVEVAKLVKYLLLSKDL